MYWEIDHLILSPTFSINTISTLHQEDLHLDINIWETNLIWELNSLFTITQLLHFLSGYPTMTLLHYMTILSSPTWDLLCHGMARGEESTAIYRTPWLIWFFHIFIFCRLLYKDLTLEFSSYLSNHTNI